VALLSELPTRQPLLGSLAQKHVHMIGIGGIGLSAIARILLAWGAHVSGSDLHLSPLTDGLASLGIEIFEGHDVSHIEGATLVIMSSAIPADNMEVVAARERGIPVLKRSDILGEMMAGRHGIAVAGTHGKTTTTAMISYLLMEAGCDPTFIVGGILGNLGTNAHSGNGAYFVVEADEYDHMFLGLRPRTAVVTHLELDHPDCFPTLADMVGEFHRFLSLVPQEGHIVACVDEPNVQQLVAEFGESSGPAVVGYGLSHDAFWRGLTVHSNDRGGNDFFFARENEMKGQVSLSMPGEHNVKNALAALAVADLLGLDLARATEALSTFQGVKRRFEVKGKAGGVTIIDDYAHHPTEVRATLAAARQRYPVQPIWAVFQPHTYSRTKALFDEFTGAFGDADHVLITDIYAAREDDTLGIHAKDLVAAMAHRDARYGGTLDQATDYLIDHIRDGDILITLGAGDGFEIGERVLQCLEATSG